jgi:shikimate dehydrogenase
MGFIHALKQNQIEVKDKSCLIIGSGGAAYAIAYALIKCEVSSISIKNRNRKNKIKLEEWVNNRFIQKTDLDPEIIINCTPLGMHPLEQKIPSNLKVNKTNIVIDTIYNPLKTKWLKHCEENGAKIINGLEMLIYQGIASLNIWLNKDFFKELDIKTIKNRLEKEIC